MNSLRIQLFAVVALMGVFLIGCRKVAPPAGGGTLAVLVDRTLSVSAHGMSEYPTYFHGHVVASLRPGERVLIESISDQDTLSDPPLRVVDTTLPSVSAPVWTFNDDYQSYAKRCRATVATQVPVFGSARAGVENSVGAVFGPNQLARKSYILDGIEDVSEFLSHQSGPRVLVLFTDGIEDSVEYGRVIKFDSPGFWQREDRDGLIRELRGQHRIANLSGVEVYFVGAAAKRPEEFRDDQSFWQAYFSASGVESKHLHYGHEPTWEETNAPPDIEAALCNVGLF